MLLAVVLIIATGCVRWQIDGLPTLRDSLAEMGRCNFDYNKVIKKNPKDFAANLCRGKAYYREGQYDMAISDYTKAIELYPKDDTHYNNLAWILATCPDAKYRNDVEALKLANKAVEIKSVASNLDTLAAAYAEMGNFEDAIKSRFKNRPSIN
jgi:tetratricopeptide (TPR) repeat protein